MARAKASGKDIVVLQRGSDWNVCGEMLYRRVWCRDEFVKALGDGFVLVTVDNPEVLGALPLAIDDAGYHRDGSVAESPELRLQNRVGESAAQAACEIVVVASEGKVPFTRGADGAFSGGADAQSAARHAHADDEADAGRQNSAAGFPAGR